MKTLRLILLGAIVLSGLLMAGVSKTTPYLLNYQGRLQNPSTGAPFSGSTVDLTFRFYDVASGGTALLTVSQGNVAISEGLFNVLIGSGTVTPGAEPDLLSVFDRHPYVYMGVSAGADPEMTPRSLIGSSPYTLKSEKMNMGLLDAFMTAADYDGDGHDKLFYGGDDCNDDNPLIHPGAPDLYLDDIDQDCSGADGLAVMDQLLSDLSTTFIVDRAVSEGSGLLVAFDDNNGQPGQVLGFEPLVDGLNTALTVTTNRPINDGETVFVQVHHDFGVIGAFEGTSVDYAFFKPDGIPIRAKVSLTVLPGTPAVRFSVTNSGTSGWVFTSVEPAAFSSLVQLGPLNPQLSLYPGWRYELVNPVFGSHPFELVTLGASQSSDVVLLSQTATGSFESDPAVDWFDDGLGAIRWTASPSIQPSLTGYRCGVHRSNMRGPITFL